MCLHICAYAYAYAYQQIRLHMYILPSLACSVRPPVSRLHTHTHTHTHTNPPPDVSPKEDEDDEEEEAEEEDDDDEEEATAGKGKRQAGANGSGARQERRLARAGSEDASDSGKEYGKGSGKGRWGRPRGPRPLTAAAPRKRSRAYFGDDVYEMELQMHLDMLAHERKPPRPPAAAGSGPPDREEYNTSLWGIKGSPYYKASVDEAVDSSTRMYRPWFSQFANRFVTIARKAQAQDLTKARIFNSLLRHLVVLCAC